MSNKTTWFYGLPCSGKTTIVKALDTDAVHLDGDVVREGLCNNLTFTKEDRAENLRRIAEVAKLFNKEGKDVLCTFVAPLQEHRDLIKKIIPDVRFILVDTPLAECEKRDVKGMYAKARKGIIKDFTGIGSPFEKGVPDYTIKTDKKLIDTIQDTIKCLKEIQEI